MPRPRFRRALECSWNRHFGLIIRLSVELMCIYDFLWLHYYSRRYNTFIESSDLDLFAIVLYPAYVVAGLFPPESTLKNPPGSNYDFTVHVLVFIVLLAT